MSGGYPGRLSGFEHADETVLDKMIYAENPADLAPNYPYLGTAAGGDLMGAG
jgi:hypothetical protein